MQAQVDVIDKTAERRKQVADLTGKEDLTAVQLEVGKLLDSGLLIDLDLHGFSMLSASVSWEELGMNPNDARRQRTSRGRKALVPKQYDKLASIEVRLRKNLNDHTFSVTGFLPWRWLPFSAYDAWKERHEQILAELEALKAQIIAHLDEFIDDNVAYFTRVARRAWFSYHAPDDKAVIKTASGRYFEGYDAFETFIIESALEQMPLPDEIEYGIYAEYHTGYLIAPPEVYAMQAAQEAAWAEADKARAEADLARQAEREKRLELDTRSAQIAAVKRAEYERAKEQLAALTSPIEEVTEQFRAQIFEAVTKAAESIQSLGHIHGKTAEKLVSLKSLYETLAGVTDDAELTAALDKLTTAMQAPGAGEAKYNLGAVETAIQAVVDVTQDAAYELQRKAETKTRSRFLEF